MENLKEQLYIDFLEAINNALAPEDLLRNIFPLIHNIFSDKNINRILLLETVKDSNELSVKFDFFTPEVNSIIKYRIPALPEQTKTTFEKKLFWEHSNIANNILNESNICSLIGVELNISPEITEILAITSKDKTIKFSENEKKIFLRLACQLTTAIQRTEHFHKNTNQIQTLKNQNYNLREQEHLRTSLINNISHEFRTPLSSILGFSNLLLTKKQTQESFEEIIKQIQQSANRLSSLLTDFLQASKSNIELWGPKLEPCDLGELIKTSVEEYAILNRGHKLCYNISDNYPIINTDPKLIRVVLDNLLSNAIKYSPNGGTISVSLELSNKEMKISITDRGLGIKEEEKVNIFKRFYRSSNPEIENISGSGLGLAICKEIISTLNGNIEATSELKKGSTFIFTLPVK